jgi:protein gp37
MAEGTLIEWATHSFSPWHGCQKVSAGCKHCYAEVSTPVRVKRAQGLEVWGPPKTTRRARTAASTWAQVRSWNRRARRGRELAEAFGGECERPRVFPSLCDVFEDHPDANAARPDFWALVDDTPELDWLLLTKRTENVRQMVPQRWLEPGAWPEHVWIGASVEDQATADERVPHLLAVPAQVRFLSVEPLLSPVNLQRWLREQDRCDGCGTRPLIQEGSVWCPCCAEGAEPADCHALSWLIVGGESGPNARPCDVAWIRDLVRQGREAEVPVFVKQLGACYSDPVAGIAGRMLQLPPEAAALIRDRLGNPKGGDPSEWPEDLRVREMPHGR